MREYWKGTCFLCISQACDIAIACQLYKHVSRLGNKPIMTKPQLLINHYHHVFVPLPPVSITASSMTSVSNIPNLDRIQEYGHRAEINTAPGDGRFSTRSDAAGATDTGAAEKNRRSFHPGRYAIIATR